MLFICLLFLVGCNRATIREEAINGARIAIDEGDFYRGSLLLVRGGCADLHAQSVYLIHMNNYRNNSNLTGMIYSWKNIYLLDATEDFIKTVAYEMLDTVINQLVFSE